MEDDTYQAMQVLVNRVEDLDDSSSGTFVLSQKRLTAVLAAWWPACTWKSRTCFAPRGHRPRIAHQPRASADELRGDVGAWRKRARRPRVHVVPQRIGGLLNAQKGEKAPWTFQVHNLSHWFQSPKSQALHQFSFEARAGQLVGIMGGSGSGKSTLLSILNGSMRPTFGSVKLMDVDIHAAPERVAGLIGHVPQEDVLVEELTVRENLAFNAKLSLSHLSEDANWQGGPGASTAWALGNP